MIFTIWEKNLLHTLFQGQTHPHISKVEAVLKLRKAFSLTDEEKALFSTAGPDEPVEIHNKQTDISLTVSDVKYILEQIEKPDTGMPARQETILLYDKLKTVAEGANTV